jgi:hypothetical protein
MSLTEAQSTDLGATLDEREKTYGDFNELAKAIQAHKSVLRASPAYPKMTAVQRECMEMDIVKNCRIMYGDPFHFDSWRDKAGYAMLAVEEFHPRADGRKMQAAANPQTPVQLEQAVTQQ